jgi:hypothetical protein
MVEDARIHVLQERMENLSDTVTRVDTKLDGIAATLSSLARIEERQVNTSERLSTSSTITADHESRIRILEKEMPVKAEDRITAIEKAMPGLIENRGWVISGVLGVLSLVGLAVVKLVLMGA